MGAGTHISRRLGVWRVRRGGELRHSLRLTVAALAAFGVAETFSLEQGYWAVFTAVLVTQASVGGSVKAALDWLLSTFGGGAYAALVGTVFPHTDRMAMGVGLAVVLAPLAFLAAVRPTFRFAPVTGAIIVMVAPLQHMSALDSAISRLFEISLGGFIGLAVSLFIFPARASQILNQTAAGTLKTFAALLPVLLRPGRARHQAELTAKHDAALGHMAKLTLAVDEAKRELSSYLSDEPDPEPVLRTLQRLRADIIMLGRATAEPFPEALQARLQAPLGAVVDAIAGFFRATAASLEDRRPPPDLEKVAQAIASYGREMADVRQAGLMRGLPGDVVGRTFAVGFSLEQLHGNMKDLASRTGERARKRKLAPEA